MPQTQPLSWNEIATRATAFAKKWADAYSEDAEAQPLRVLHSGAQHWQILSNLTQKARLQGGQFHDARIAAICLENSVSVLYTADRDFGRFKDLKTRNPLV